MKKRSLIISMVLFLALFCMLITGCSHTHTWKPEDCVSPKICTECGEQEGEALGHKWVEATCTESRFCTVCGLTGEEAKGHVWTEATCMQSRYCTVCGLESGEALGHVWLEATCIAPEVCHRCNEVQGEALGHQWKPATCEEMEICKICGVTQGEKLGHIVEEWTVVLDSTCTEIGSETGVCRACEKTCDREIALKEHTPGEWEVILQPTPDKKGIRIQKCTVCDFEMKQEEFTLSEEELEKLYKDNCQKISYDSLSRTPDDYKGQYVKFSGRVVQVCSEAESKLYYSTYRVATSGRYDNVVYIKVDNYGSGSRILEEDKITFYGEYEGLYSYKTVMGAEVTIPCIIVKYID